VPYYVPVGLRGILLHLGTNLTGLFGAVVYWRACRRRRHALPAGEF
jgi:hypothetical protein